MSAAKRVWALGYYSDGGQSFSVRKHWEVEPSLAQIATCFSSSEAIQDAGFGTSVARLWAGFEEKIGDTTFFVTVIDDDDEEWRLL